VVGVLADDGAQAVAVEELVLALTQVQHHLGAAARRLDGLQAVVALAGRFPVHPVLGGEAGAAGGHRDLVGDDEGRIETDAELADEAGVLGLIAGQGLEELAGTGLGDGPEVVHDLLAAHAHAVVADGDGARVLVVGDLDLQVAVALEQGIVGQGLEAQLVRRIRGIGDQLSEEDFLVAVQGVDHQVQQLPDLGLELQGFLMGFYAHRAPRSH